MDVPPPDMTPIIIATTSQPPLETGSSGQPRNLTTADRAMEVFVWIMLGAAAVMLVLALFAVWFVFNLPA